MLLWKFGFGGSSSKFGVSFLKFSAALYLVRLDFSRLRSEHSVCRNQVGKKCSWNKAKTWRCKKRLQRRDAKISKNRREPWHEFEKSVASTFTAFPNICNRHPTTFAAETRGEPRHELNSKDAKCESGLCRLR